ncbi:MAG: HAD-IC family P-type ATPase [Thermomicrobiales bacterium]
MNDTNGAGVLPASAARPPAAAPATPPFVTSGLTTAEVALRRAQGQGNDAPLPENQTYGQILRRNLLTFLNSVLTMIGVALLVLGRVNDAVSTVGIMAINVLVGTVQELYAKRKLDRITLLTRPIATVVRDGQERPVAPGELVTGDLLVARAGDQLVVDGEIVGIGRLELDEALLTGESDPVVKQAGDQVFAGSSCLAGGGRYIATRVGAASLARQLTVGARAFRQVRTPLQREIDVIIRLLVLLVCQFGFLLGVASRLQGIPLVESVQIAAVVAGLVPNGLILTISAAYALGALRMAGKGALVRQANAVESLSHINVLCLDKTGTLTANRLTLEAVQPLGAPEAEVRALLGAYAASTTNGNKTIAAIGAACGPPDAVWRITHDVPFSSARQWSALAVHDGVQGGIYVLGAPERLQTALVPGQDYQPYVDAWLARGRRVLLFAYRAGLAPLYDAGNQPCLPDSLAPLGLVSFRDELRPEAAATLAGFAAAGVQLKVISGDHPDTVAALARQAGLGPALQTCTGADLDGLTEDQIARLAAETTIFGRITPAQKARLVRALRASGRYVAMIGDGVNDVLALKEAQVGVAMQSGSPAARAVADLILLHDSFAALLPAVREGQRILNGMTGIFRLFLTRIAAEMLVILAVAVLAVPFPFMPTHISLLTLLTVGLPTFALAVWAKPGPPPGQALRRLSRFVIPAAWTLAIAALVVYLPYIFLHAATPHARTALTVTTILAGVLLIVFAAPPVRLLAGGEPAQRDWRPAVLAAVMLAALALILRSAAWRGFFALAALGPGDYLWITAVTGAWAAGLNAIWWTRAFERFLNLEDESPH